MRRNSSVVSAHGFDPEGMKRRVAEANKSVELEDGSYEHTEKIKY